MALNINGTTGISGVDGSVSAPAVTGTDSNTGITFPSADTIKFSTGGVERISITNSGISGTGILTTGGKILQVVQGTKTTGTSAASATYGDLGLSVAITPQTNSKILALINIQSGINSSNNSGFGVKLLRDSTAVYTSNTDYDVQNNTSATSDGRFRNSWHILDSSVGGDGSTSFTYKIQVATHGGRSVTFSDGNNLCTITLFEIGA